MSGCDPVTIHSEALDLNADCAEFCPIPGLTHLLALGTYELVEESNQRVGRAYLRVLRRDSADGPPTSSTLGCSLVMPGIFDLKWRPMASSDVQGALFGAALADGTVRILEAVVKVRR